MTQLSNLWPLILIIEDCYVPDSAAAVLEGLKGVDEHSQAMTIRLFAMDARAEVERQRN